MTVTGQHYAQKIKELFAVTNVSIKLIQPVLNCPSFEVWPASCTSHDGRPPRHHGGIGGLARHTYEVLYYALAAAKPLPSVHWAALAVGAVWHDFGKIEEYNRPPGHPALFTRQTPQLSHICHGLMMWRENTGDLYLQEPPLFEAVAHIIASHHGRKEWGAPVEPQTIEALLVHQADMVSVMLDSGTNPAHRP